MSYETKLYDLDGIRRFDDRAAHYARGRPSYPMEAIRAIVRGTPAALDLGAGTGISTRLLAQGGARAVAGDPNAAMVVGAGVPAVITVAESMPFSDASFDLVTAFNSFHWMKPEPAFAEMRRVLRSDGRLAVVWNDWNLDDAFTRDFVRLMRSYAGSQPHEDREREAAPLFATRQFHDVERHDFANTHVMDRELLHDRMFSISYIPREGPQAARVMSAIDDLHARYAGSDGTVTHHYVTCVYIAKRTP